jgi:hypothetical protein
LIGKLIMARVLPSFDLIKEAARLARAAVRPAAPWLAWLVLVGGLFAAFGPAGGWLAALLIAKLFAAGIIASDAVYGAMLPAAAAPGLRRILALAQANAAVYVAFMFLTVFVGFFLLVLPGILLEASGESGLSGDADPAAVQLALARMLPTAYGAAWIALTLIGLSALCFAALRLLLVGAATVVAGKAMVFRTWRWTKGHAIALGFAALGTHVLPYLLGAVLVRLASAGIAADFLRGALAVLLLIPFIVLGHGLAAAAHARLKPAA